MCGLIEVRHYLVVGCGMVEGFCCWLTGVAKRSDRFDPQRHSIAGGGEQQREGRRPAAGLRARHAQGADGGVGGGGGHQRGQLARCETRSPPLPLLMCILPAQGN